MELLQNFTTFALFGLIWIIQLVHYPAFRYIEPDRFDAFHRMHTRNISIIVIPLMMIELVSAFWLALFEPTRGLFQSTVSGLTLVIWLSTFGLQAPCHNCLKKGKDMDQIERLVITNWLRTWAWSLKAGLLALG